MLNKELDATHSCRRCRSRSRWAPARFAQPMRVATIQNINGQAITLALKHRNKPRPEELERVQVRDPVRVLDAQLPLALLPRGSRHQSRHRRPVAGRAAPRNGRQPACRQHRRLPRTDPINQRAVYDEAGFIHILSKDIWDGHPCCAFGVSEDFVKQNPNTFAALYRAVLTATAMAHDAKNRELIAKVISPAAYLNQPEAVVTQVLTGKFADGLGNVQNVPGRAGLRPGAVVLDGRVDAHADEALGAT